MQSLFCLLYGHKYSINLQLDIRESKPNSCPKGSSILGTFELSEPNFLLGMPSKGEPGVCESCSFAQWQVFMLKSKGLQLLAAITLGPKLWSPLGNVLSGTPLYFVQPAGHIISIPGSLP